MKLTKYILIVVAISALATSCKLGPEYKRPEVVSPEKFRFY